MLTHYVDFDGTLADDSAGWQGHDVHGAPVPAMAAKVRAWLAQGDRVVIFTARATDWALLPPETVGPCPFAPYNPQDVVPGIQDWTERHFGVRLPVTALKGPWDRCYDDKVHRIVKNTGLTVEETILEYLNDRIQDERFRDVAWMLQNVAAFVKSLAPKDLT